MTIRFSDRREAGRLLAHRLSALRTAPNLLVLALPRGGVPVAYEVALALDAPLDVLVVRKLGIPGHEELAMGAIASGDVRVLDRHLIRHLGITDQEVSEVTQRERAELERRERDYRDMRSPPDIRAHTVVLVDDGLATGATMRAAVSAVRDQQPARVIVAVPVASTEACAEMQHVADLCACVTTPQRMVAVGHWYLNFDQTTDEEVRQLLDDAAHRSPSIAHT